MMSKADAGKEAEKKKFDPRLVPTFLQKTYALVDGKESNEIVGWGTEPSTFVIYDPNRFAREVLPQFFKQNKMSSFVRQVRKDNQLNMYDFHKRTSSDSRQHVFYHPLFQKGQEHLLAKIKRKKNPKKASKGNSVSAELSTSVRQKRSRFLEDVGPSHAVQTD